MIRRLDVFRAALVATVLAVRTNGIEFTQGVLHESFGLTTFIAGTLAMVLTARLLR